MRKARLRKARLRKARLRKARLRKIKRRFPNPAPAGPQSPSRGTSLRRKMAWPSFPPMPFWRRLSRRPAMTLRRTSSALP
ncbi:MAG: hypothetical protein ACLRWC_01900 [Acutalibacter sp.]